MSTSSLHNIPNSYDISERRYSGGSPQRSPRLSLRRRKRVEYLDDTSEGSDGRTSSDEYDPLASSQNMSRKHDPNNNNNNNNGNGKARKTSTFSNVKKKITSTFQRRHSVSMHTPTPAIHKQPPIRRLSTVESQSPRMLHRPISMEDPDGPHKRKNSLRRFAAGRLLNEKNSFATSSNPNLTRILQQKAQFQLEASSSTPNIARKLQAPTKHFNIHLLGSRNVGKTALTVRFLTGRYIHEYKSVSEESYNRVMKYGDESVDVKISINDIENMKGEIELDQDSGIMILYSIVDEASFMEAKSVLKYLADSTITGHYPVMLIGTKRDLSRNRQVHRNDAFSIANKYSCTQFDVSSATDKRVKDCFHALFRQIEIRHLLHNNDDAGPTVVNPPIIPRNGSLRYGTA